MRDHKSIDHLRAELGVITFDNQSLYFEYFLSHSDWNEREALEWIRIFDDDDYDDYGAFAWDIVLLVERQISIEGISELVKIRNYWAQLALWSVLEPPTTEVAGFPLQ
ncbi:hypothetical protein IHN32_07575 [Deinococcus sp. 14RED07]|uniref:hypothetical protein n=1 Tax=unclassified Deinococcus TaxID=2623546 RepID=UPI001E65464B|nr:MULTISPECIES: hypothetical protein [unclassified Deinococcus]MCD0161608.1 hypothetical protein [Deinococcus sp. 6YEL10]MCD0175801.1 hypothetical protein [Deinococcus sp. 14RED07]